MADDRGSSVKNITPDDLASLLKSSDTSYLVVDVRDVDFHGGNIKGAINMPSPDFNARVQDLIKETKEKGIQKVIFHCYMSQIRGPQAALLYEQALLSSGTKQDVLILEGGFTLFQTKFKEDPNLVENFDSSVWDEERWDREVWAID